MNSSRQSLSIWRFLTLWYLGAMMGQTAALVAPSTRIIGAPTVLFAANGEIEDDIARQVKRAKELLAKSKAKVEKQDVESTTATMEAVPFFATSQQQAQNVDKMNQIVKYRDEKTGLVMADGEMMAKLSEAEQWESRSLMEVFENENKADPASTSRLAERDVAASIMNLRKTLQTEDFMKIFDSRNRFIGES